MMKTTQVQIREIFRLVNMENPVSGHRWTEHGPTTGYQVIGAVGVHSRHRTEAGARKEAKELQAFYDKFGL